MTNKEDVIIALVATVALTIFLVLALGAGPIVDIIHAVQGR